MKSFERSGFWWDPREPEQRWPGTLRFDSVSGAVLTLTQPFDLSRFSSAGREFPLMHGETTGMGKVTLVDSFERGSDEIFANAVIDGFHAAEPDPPVWVAAAVIERLNDWWNKTALSKETSIGGPDISIRYDAVQPVEVHSDSDMRVTLHSWPLPNVDRWNVSVKEELRIEFSALKPIPLSVFRRRVHACQDLLSVATLSLCNVEDFRFIPADQNGEKAKFIAHHYAIPVFRDPSERWVDGLFRYDDIASRPGDVFGAWFENAERLSAVRSLYLSAAYGKGFLELKLLAFTQAAEAYHRRVYEGKDRYMDEAAYQEIVVPVLQAAIPDTLGKSHRDSLKKRLRFANELSFRNRMKALFREHEAAMAAVVPSPCSWIERIVDYRNTLTHHPVAEESPSSDRLDLVQCNYVLRILLECCFLKSMSLTTDDIKALADRNGQYKAIRSRFFESKHTPYRCASLPTALPAESEESKLTRKYDRVDKQYQPDCIGKTRVTVAKLSSRRQLITQSLSSGSIATLATTVVSALALPVTRVGVEIGQRLPRATARTDFPVNAIFPDYHRSYRPGTSEHRTFLSRCSK